MCIEENKNEWIVKDDFNKERIDYWLKKNIPNISYPILCKFIRKGIVRINGKRTKNSHILNTGDIVKFSRQINIDSPKIIKGNYDKKFSGFIQSLILYKNEEIIALNKPSGLAVQGGSKVKLNLDLMLDSLKFKLKERPRLVHRLDKQTSGLMIIARTLKASKFYADLFKKRLIEKKYLAIVSGKIKEKNGNITSQIYINDKAFNASTFFKVLDIKQNFTFLILKPITGRKHQIRNHLNSIGNPIYGETKFKNFNNFKLNNNFHLHSYSLNFKDSLNQSKKILSPIPDYFLNTLKKYNFDSTLKDYNLELNEMNNSVRN
ncbi:MAG: pseudouridine synthase [Alphaproteobacteria bacterium]